MKRIISVFAVIMCALIAGFVWYIRKDTAVAKLPAPSPSLSPSTSPSPTPEIVPSPTPVLHTPQPLSVLTNARVDYVRDRLVQASIQATDFNSVLADRRLTLYPVKTVAYKAPNWKTIEDKLYSAASVQKGLDYIAANLAVFEQTEKDYGVKKEALAGLIAIETDFGKNAGTYPIFSVLYSRMMRWPAATWQAQADQLVAFSTYCIRSKIDCFSVKGSYAGAFGIVQFMPNSLLAYGVDGNNDGVIDLSRPVDAIPSAANFLKAHGWDADQLKALARYYGSSEGYPGIVLTYASLLAKH